MIISDSKQFIFIHIPKCAGNTVRHWLKPYDTRDDFFWGLYQPYDNPDRVLDLAHVNLTTLRSIVGEPTFSNYQKFCVVRNPYDRTYSAFVEALKFFPEYQRKGFKAFLLEQLKHWGSDSEQFGIYQRTHFTPQHDYIFDRQGQQLVESICRLEQLTVDLAEVAEKLQLQYPEKLESKAVRGSHSGGHSEKQYQYMDQYDKACIRIVNKIYAKDFSMLGYDVVEEPVVNRD